MEVKQKSWKEINLSQRTWNMCCFNIFLHPQPLPLFFSIFSTQSASSIRIINFYYSCQFSLFDFYYSNPLCFLNNFLLLRGGENRKIKSNAKVFWFVWCISSPFLFIEIVVKMIKHKTLSWISYFFSLRSAEKKKREARINKN